MQFGLKSRRIPPLFQCLSDIDHSQQPSCHRLDRGCLLRQQKSQDINCSATPPYLVNLRAMIGNKRPKTLCRIRGESNPISDDQKIFILFFVLAEDFVPFRAIAFSDEIGVYPFIVRGADDLLPDEGMTV